MNVFVYDDIQEIFVDNIGMYEIVEVVGEMVVCVL